MKKHALELAIIAGVLMVIVGFGIWLNGVGPTLTILATVLTLGAIIFAICFWRQIVEYAQRIQANSHRYEHRDTVSGSVYGQDVGSSTVVVIASEKPRLVVGKGVANLSNGDKRYKKFTGQPIRCAIGDILSFQPYVANTGHSPIPAAEVRMKDCARGFGQLIPGTVKAMIGKGTELTLDDDFIEEEFSMADIPGAPDELPGRTALYIRYEVCMREDSGGGGSILGGGFNP